MGAAKKRQRLERDWKKKTKAAVEALDLLSADELVARMPDYDAEESRPAPGAARIVKHRGQTVAQMKAVSQAAEQPLRTPAGEATIDRMTRAVERLRTGEGKESESEQPRENTEHKRTDARVGERAPPERRAVRGNDTN